MKISIITPSYNQGAFIERTIQSVLSQSIAGLEYWVIDGGSQDETLAILNRYTNQLRYISEQDSGQAHAVNKGLALSSGEIIGWLNSDDIYYPETINKVLRYFQNYPHVEVLYGDAYHIDRYDEIIAPYPVECWDINQFKKHCYLSQPAVFWRRSLLQRFGFLDESLHYCMDYEYWLRLALNGVRFGYLSQVLAGSRLYAETKTMRAPLMATSEALSMLKKHLRTVPAEWLFNYSLLHIRSHMQSLFRLPSTFSRLSLHYNGIPRGLMSCMYFPKLFLKRAIRKLAVIRRGAT